MKVGGPQPAQGCGSPETASVAWSRMAWPGTGYGYDSLAPGPGCVRDAVRGSVGRARVCLGPRDVTELGQGAVPALTRDGTEDWSAHPFRSVRAQTFLEGRGAARPQKTAARTVLGRKPRSSCRCGVSRPAMNHRLSRLRQSETGGDMR